MIRDTATALAKALLDAVANCLREEEHGDAFRLFREIATGALVHYERTRRSWERKFPKPSDN